MNNKNIFICPLCGKIFYNSSGLYRHLSRSHSNYSFIISSPFLIKILMKMERNIEEIKNIYKIISLLESIESLLRDIREQLSINSSTNLSSRDVKKRRVDENTPSFLIGNPWIKVLSRRGMEV